MLDQLSDLVDHARGRASYAEARRVHTRSEDVSVLDDRCEAVTAAETDGIGVRVAVEGGWGFAATRDTSDAGARRALARAIEIAAAAPKGMPPPRAPLAPDPPGGH